MFKALIHFLHRHPRQVVSTCLGVALFLLTPPVATHDSQPLEEIRTRDFLAVYTRNTPTTYYEGRHGPTGFEYDLMLRFAEHLGVSLSMDANHNIEGVLDAVRRGEGDLGAAALPLDPSLPGINFSRPILTLQPLLVYRRGLPPVRQPQDLLGLSIGVISGSGTSLILRELQREMPSLSWKEAAELEVADLLQRVENGNLDAAVIYAHQFKLNRLFYPEVENGFPLGEPLSMAWAFPARQGLGVLEEANRFLLELQRNGTLAELIDSYFGHDDYLEYVGARIFIHHIREKLPEYTELFRAAARETGFDWKLLAALGYQESHWDPQATSPTGVRGLMMLTLPTASELGVANRLDPKQSIDGGARYLRQMKERLQEEIQGPDRLWMALAAYNVGLGHLYDAQRIAEMRGGDPYVWADVREALPLLQNREWYSQTRHGYARGGEPVIYVRNIRRYYEILNYVDRSQQQFHQLNQRMPDADDDSELFDTVPPVL
ncbi:MULTISPECIES: membrane-bound lytic murein transglycosylase MltF [Halomonadaceae]|uniref:membrane-bound lytic murein transglycosylase MltF n=1 Tax=Halomonadaceae TaxID=28256 RepID=UPI0015997EA9|nr:MULTISPECIES: membrane-bound lytic murein transglycosylase MltF [Halomonas]QJQ95097.1 membrane-bound lytic murein transglycosylase MltF [Halomonas sp. PA5]